MNNWQTITLIESKMVAEDIKSLTFSAQPWVEHKPGQHYNIRLTSPDGYQAERDYSVASAPDSSGFIEFGVQILPDGEVSPYLFNMKKGEQIEVKGPIGGYFIWDIDMKGPLVLIGGGSGIVPLMSILRHYVNNYDKDKNREIIFIVSAKSEKRIPYYSEINEYKKKYPSIKLSVFLTKDIPADWKGHTGRINEIALSKILSGLKEKMPLIYVCGRTDFVEIVSGDLVELGFNSHEIFTERFG